MTRKWIAAFLAMAVWLSLCGCDTSSPSSDLTETVPTIAPTLTIGDPDSSSAVPMTDFGVKLFQNAYSADENTLLSPLSVLCALAMTANGSADNTRSQIEHVLGMPTDELNAAMADHLAALSANDNAALSLANSVWLTKDTRFTADPSFLQICKSTYDASVFEATFDDRTVSDINRWVSENTNGMIDGILDRIPADAVMYLVNALAFEASWSSPYHDYQVHEDTFTCENGTTQTAEFMVNEENHYLETDNAVGFLKYYRRSEYAFAALLPKDDVSVEDLVDSLDGDFLHTLLSSPQSHPVIASIPKFEAEYSADLIDLLKEMGMTDAFDIQKADFSAMGHSENGELFINRILHKAYISVFEQGTKAGAATVVEMADGASPADPPEPYRVTLDRPFVYMIVDCENHVPLFIGAMMSPSDA